MGWKCVKCGYLTEENLEKCPKCGKEVIWRLVATKIERVKMGTIIGPNGTKTKLDEKKE